MGLTEPLALSVGMLSVLSEVPTSTLGTTVNNPSASGPVLLPQVCLEPAAGLSHFCFCRAGYSKALLA